MKVFFRYMQHLLTERHKPHMSEIEADDLATIKKIMEMEEGGYEFIVWHANDVDVYIVVVANEYDRRVYTFDGMDDGFDLEEALLKLIAEFAPFPREEETEGE